MKWARPPSATSMTVGSLTRTGTDVGVISCGVVFRNGKRPQMRGKQAYDLIDDFLMRHVARFDGEIGQSIDRITLLDQLAHDLGRISCLQKRSIMPTPDAPHEHIEFSVKPNRDSLGSDGGTGIGIHEGTATRRQNLRSVLQ